MSQNVRTKLQSEETPRSRSGPARHGFVVYLEVVQKKLGKGEMRKIFCSRIINRSFVHTNGPNLQPSRAEPGRVESSEVVL